MSDETNRVTESAKLLAFKRDRPAYVRHVIENFIPDSKQRRTFIELFADLVKVANENPRGWGITLHHGPEILLYVGGGHCALCLRRNYLKLLWLGEGESDPPVATTGSAYVPGSRSGEATPQEALGWVPGIHERMLALIRRTNESSSVLHGNSRPAHSPGVLRYIEEELKITLPDPVYPQAEVTNNAAEERTQTDTSTLKATTMPQFPLNTILYGPPGTGKTYETAKRAVQIIDGNAPKDRAELMQRYKALRKDGRIAFVTFHQSYSYEDFVEGIRPVMEDDDEAAGSPRYRLADGILKELALDALGASLRRVSLPDPAKPTFAALWEELIARIENDPDWTLPGLGTSAYQLSETPQGNLRGINVNGKAQEPYTASRKKIEKVWNQLPPEQKPRHSVLMEILKVGTHTNLIGAVIEEFRRMTSEAWDADEPEPWDLDDPGPTPQDKAQSYLETGEESGYALAEQADRFVLIIDEINRGNISKILGELITLLEDDKRIGEVNELTVTLPYSRDSFALPPNLYVLATMNTADKSLALLDIALRRRFVFEELAPKFDVCGPPLAPEMKTALDELNRRITLRKDRDHRIGHAFFMGVGENEARFNDVFTARIIPLLQEFFFNDWDGLRTVLGETEKNEGFVRPMGGAGDSGARNRWQWYTDAGVEIEPLRQLVNNYNRSKPGDGDDSG